MCLSNVERRTSETKKGHGFRKQDALWNINGWSSQEERRQAFHKWKDILSIREMMCFLDKKEDMFEGKTGISFEIISICILETKTSILQRETMKHPFRDQYSLLL